MKYLLFCGLMLLVACTSPVDRNIVGAYTGGQITLVDVESVLLFMPSERRMLKESRIIDAYREIARDLALERILFPGQNASENLLDVFKRKYINRYRMAVVRLYRFRTRMETVATAMSDVQRPPGTVILEKADFLNILANGENDQVLLKVQDGAFTREDVLRLLNADAQRRPKAPTPQELYDLYMTHARNHLLYAEAIAAGFTEKTRVRRQLKASLSGSVRKSIFEARAWEKMGTKTGSSEGSTLPLLEGILQEANYRFLEENVRQLLLVNLGNPPSEESKSDLK